jgi:hypothetical protein
MGKGFCYGFQQAEYVSGISILLAAFVLLAVCSFGFAEERTEPKNYALLAAVNTYEDIFLN